MRYSNVSSVPLSMAVFLATDNYDHNPDPNTVSATTLLKPLRQLVLSARLPVEAQAVDLLSQMANRMGAALHDGIERAWVDNHTVAMERLGFPKGVIKQVRVNPLASDMAIWEASGEPIIPVYLEQRAHRKIGKWTVSGKFDFVGDGRVEDFKSTSVFTYMNQTNNDKYAMQGSIYRWLNPKLITQDKMAIQFIFTDWAAFRAKAEPGYPQSRTIQQLFDLKSLTEIDAFIKRKLNQIDQLWDAPEAQLPLCTDEELWRSAPVFKFYANPAKVSGRSTKNFDSRQEAVIHMVAKGGAGVILEKPGEVTACKYCPAYVVCGQKDLLIERGDLNI